MVEKNQCTNGVTIIHEKMAHFRSVSLGIWVKAGSMDECNEETGLAHFIEHMLFKGTKTRTARIIAEEFDQIGGDINAFTSKELTCFTVTVLSEHAEKALDIMADMLFHSLFDEGEIAKEKLVILEELSTVNDTPDDDVHERLWAMMYPDDSVGRPILGDEKTIEAFDRKAIMNFMERMYRPERMVVSIAGNYDNQLIRHIDTLFGSFEITSGIKDEAIPRIPSFHTGVSVKKKDVEQTHICLGFPGLSMMDERIEDLIILDSILGGSMSSRLFQEIREERGLAYSIYSYYTAYAHTGAFIFYGGTSPEKTTDLYYTMNAVIQSVLNDGVTEQEVSNAKEQITGGFLLGLESTESRMYRNGRNELLTRKHRAVDEVVSLIHRVKKSNLNDLAKTLLDNRYAMSIIAPEETIDAIKFL